MDLNLTEVLLFAPLFAAVHEAPANVVAVQECHERG
jgi:hypothetical protein